MKKKIKIIGSGTHARVILDCAMSLKYQVDSLIDINSKKKTNEKIFGVSVKNNVYLKKITKKDRIFIAIGNNKLRTYYFNQFKKRANIINLICKDSSISKFAKIGKGIYVGNKSVINAGAIIEDNCIINSGSIIEHQTVIGRNTHICPGSVIGGNASIGQNSFVGLGSNIINKIVIGSNTIIGAGSTVIKNISSNQIYAGSPAKKIKRSK